jgi:hypothetical protein
MCSSAVIAMNHCRIKHFDEIRELLFGRVITAIKHRCGGLDPMRDSLGQVGFDRFL